MLAPELQRFIDNLPHNPFCTNDFDKFKLKQLPKQHAVNKKYVQVNPPVFICYLVFDIDDPGVVLACEYEDLPQPTFIVEDPIKRTGHIYYELKAKVCTSDNARPAPQRYCEAVYRAYSFKLKSDCGYARHTAKNPLHYSWNCVTFDNRYSLEELADYVNLPRYQRNSSSYRSDFASVGRNNALFESGRIYSYREVHQVGSMEELETRLHLALSLENQSHFSEPLPLSELNSIARSVAEWTWKNRDRIGKRKSVMSFEKLLPISRPERILAIRERQCLAGKYSSNKRREKNLDKITKAAKLHLTLGNRPTISQLSRNCTLSRRTIYRHVGQSKFLSSLLLSDAHTEGNNSSCGKSHNRNEARQHLV